MIIDLRQKHRKCTWGHSDSEWHLHDHSLPRRWWPIMPKDGLVGLSKRVLHSTFGHGRLRRRVNVLQSARRLAASPTMRHRVNKDSNVGAEGASCHATRLCKPAGVKNCHVLISLSLSCTCICVAVELQDWLHIYGKAASHE